MAWIVRVSLPGLLRNQRNPIAGMNVDVAVESRISRQRAVAGIVRRAVDRLGALIGGRKKRVIEAPGDAPDAPVEIGIESLARVLAKFWK